MTSSSSSSKVNKTVTLSLSSNPSTSAVISLNGGTVISWKVNHVEQLYLSPLTNLEDEGKAIRGGIPIVFPIFGKIDSMPGQHGFARNVLWNHVEASQDWPIDDDSKEEQVKCKLILDDTLIKNFTTYYPFHFHLELLVTLTTNQLKLDLIVMNCEIDKDLPFHALFHTYLKVDHIDSIVIKGLKGLSYKDSLENRTAFVESLEYLKIDREVDRVYNNNGNNSNNKGENELLLLNTAMHTTLLSSTTNGNNYVIWNPWIEKSKTLSQFPPEDYQKMICIEAGSVAKLIELKPLQKYILYQALRVKTD